MNKKLMGLCFAGVSLILGLGLASCAPSVVAEGQARPTPNPTATLPPYPGPTLDNPQPQRTSQPKPTRAGGTPDRYDGLFVTPRPDEQVRLGQVVEIPAPAASPPARYSIRYENKGQGADFRVTLFIHDIQTGNEVRLGSDAGHAYFGAMNDEYVIWKYDCDSCADPKPGLYAYSLKTASNLLISDTLVSRGYPEIDGRWVIYSLLLPPSDPWVSWGELHAYNLITGEDLLVASDLFYPRYGLISSPIPDHYYTLHGDKIVWITTDLARTRRVYDLTLRATQTLNVPEQPLGPILYLGIYDNIVVWLDEFWQGYDLKHDAYFTIPIVPPGWENLPVIQKDLVTAEGNTLHWSLDLDGETHYFTAPIVPKGQGVQHLVPTPHRKPTVSPIPLTPTPILLPTAYPYP